MSIAERILGVIAAVLLLPMFAAGLLLVVLVGTVGSALIESGVPEGPVGVFVAILDVGILIGTLALAFIVMLRVRRWLAVRWSPFRVEGETSTTVGRARGRKEDRATFVARVRRLDSRLSSTPKRRRDR